VHLETGALMMQRAGSPILLCTATVIVARVLVTAPHFGADSSALRSISGLAHL
jgi:hypothetical protein